MEIYIIVFLLLSISSIIDITKQSKIGNVLFYFNIIVLYIFATIRYEVGVDFAQYKSLFEIALPINHISYNYLSNNLHDIEYGYLIFESLVKFFTNEFFIFLALYNILMFSFLVLAIIRTKYYKNIQLLIFYSFVFLLYSIEAYRQGMSMVILLLSFSYFLERRYLVSIALILFATFFHKVSLIYFLVLFLLNRKYSKCIIVMVIFLSFLISHYDIIGNLVLYFKENTDFSFVRRVAHYYFSNNDTGLKISYLAYIQRTIVVCIVLYFYDKYQDYRVSNLILFSICVFLLLSNVGVLAGRISSIMMIAYLPYFSGILKVSSKNKGFIFLFVLVYSFLIFFKDLHTQHPIFHTYNYLPYKHVLNIF